MGMIQFTAGITEREPVRGRNPCGLLAGIKDTVMDTDTL